MHDDGPVGSTLRPLKHLADIPRGDTQVLRVSLQLPLDGAPIVALRVFATGASGDTPRRNRGFALRANEVAPTIAALVAALEWYRKDERAQRMREAGGDYPPRPSLAHAAGR